MANSGYTPVLVKCVELFNKRVGDILNSICLRLTNSSGADEPYSHGFRNGISYQIYIYIFFILITITSSRHA